ncbi:MAG: MMPL family transporter [Rhodobacteraceae bacterium]|nr:MMPL family transporter [Paracoccaceae bacterium]
MNELFNSMSTYFAAVPGALRPYRYLIVIVALVGTIFMGFGATKFELDTSIDSWLSEDDPAVQALDDFRRQFGSDDGLFLVYHAKDGDVFSEQSLKAIQGLTRDLENWYDLDPVTLGIDAEVMANLDHVLRVQSLANTRYQLSTEDSLESLELIPEGAAITPELAAEVSRIAHDQPTLSLLMFSENNEYGALVLSTDFGAIPVQTDDVVDELDFAADELDLALDSFVIDVDDTAVTAEVDFEDTSPAVYTGFMNALTAIYGQAEYAAAFEFYPIGTAGMMDTAMDSMIQSGYLGMISVFIIILLLYTLFQTGSAVMWPVTAVVSSCIWLFGGMAWLGIPSSSLISLSVMLVLAVGIADCVHVMSEYLLFKRESMNHEDAIEKSFEKTGVPILLTTITTMAGMLAIAFGGVGQFVTFGITSAIGVALAFVFTVAVLPALLEFWHPHSDKKPAKKSWKRAMFIIFFPFSIIRWGSKKIGLSWLLSAIWLQPLLDKVPDFSFRWRYPIIAVFMAVFVVCGYGATRVKIDSNLVELFKDGNPVRVAYEIVDEHMAGTGSMEVMMDFNASDAMSDPDVLMAISNLQDILESEYGKYVVRTNSLADLVKDTNKIMNGNDPAAYAIPEDPLAVSQLLYLFNSSNPKDRRSLVSDDYSRSHITIQLRNAGSHEYAIFFEGIQADIDDTLSVVRGTYPEMETSVTGSFAMMMRMSDVISKSQFRSLSLAIVIISIILTLSLGSLTGGLLAIIPNMLPAILAFGLMGLLGIPLDTDTLMIAPLIIGIAVDDTIHFVTHYRMALANRIKPAAALVQTVKEVGQAVTFTSMVLGLAFFMLSFSDYLGLAKVGIFGSLAIFVALLCDLLFLPALIYVFKPSFGVKFKDDPTEAT